MPMSLRCNCGAPSKVSPKTGFTLIELLVVIAIIAILASILFPVFARARENARRSSCQSNQKQIGLAIMQYVQDYDERMPRGRYGDGGSDSCNWTFSIMPYAKSRELFTCPSASRAANANLNNNVQGTAAPISYIANEEAFSTAVNDRSPAHISLFNAPALTVLLLEGQGNYNDPSLYINSGSNEPGDVFSGSGAGAGGYSATGLATGPLGGHAVYSVAFPTGRHLDGANYLFADGHVKWLKGDQVSSGVEPQPGSPDANCYQDQYSPNCAWGGPPTFSAAGTLNMSDGSGHKFAATMSKK